MSAASPKTPLTLGQKLNLFAKLSKILFKTLLAAITGPFRGPSGTYLYKHHVIHSLIREALGTLSTEQYQRAAGPFDKIYMKWCKDQGIATDFVETKGGVKGFWVGDRKAKNVVVYYHGGGFALDASLEYLRFWPSVQSELSAAGKSVAFFFVQYTLTPHATYPTQFREGVEALRYILEDEGRSPSDVLLAGDSAGGNMALAVISHLSHPSPDVPTKIEISSPLKGMILMAPWTTFRTDFASGVRNYYKDYLSGGISEKWSSAYMGGRKSDNYAEPALADVGWWKDAKVQQTLFVAGSDELLVDPVTEFSEKWKINNPNTELVIGSREPHIAPLIWPAFGDMHETEQGAAVKSWMKSRL